MDDLCHELAGETACYLFLDDFHLLTDNRVCRFLCTLTNRLPGNVHLIVASRDRFLPAAETVRLGARVYQIGTEQLRLNHTELAVYAHRCGTDLSDAQVESLLYSSEGWFSAVYLNLRTLSEQGALPDRNSDIYTTFTAAMIDPLPARQREFLAVMGLADEFTVEMARFVTGDRRRGGAARRADRAERLCQASAGRRHLPLPPHDEGVRRAQLPDPACGGAGAPTGSATAPGMSSTGSTSTPCPPTGRAGIIDALLRVVQEDAGHPACLASARRGCLRAWRSVPPPP